MMLGLAAFAGIAAVSEGFSVVSPARWPLGSHSSASFAADAAAAVNTCCSGSRPKVDPANTKMMMSQATGVGTETGAPTEKALYDQKSWALVRISVGACCRVVQTGCGTLP